MGVYHSAVLYFFGALLVTALVGLVHGRLGKMPTLCVPIGRGWKSDLRTSSTIDCALDFGIGAVSLVLAIRFPWAIVGTGALAYFVGSSCAFVGATKRRERERWTEIRTLSPAALAVVSAFPLKNRQ